MQPSPIMSSLSPSFNSYSNGKLAEIAARVVSEFDPEEEFYSEFYFENEEKDEEHWGNGNELESQRNEDSSEEESEFEFGSMASRDVIELASPVSADEIFQNGRIRPVYPVFNRNLLFGFNVENRSRVSVSGTDTDPGRIPGSADAPRVRLPLRKLFIEERETALTTTRTSKTEELAGVPEDTYCVWVPKEAERRCRKSNSSSAGSMSKRWITFKELLKSPSDGSKGGFVFLSHSSSGKRKENQEKS